MSMIYISKVLLLICVTIVISLFVTRPDAQNRAIGIELLAIVVTALIGLLSITWQSSELLDAILAWSLFCFIGTAAISKFITEGD